MRKFGVLVVVGVLASAMYAVAPAGASVTGGSSAESFCEAYSQISADVGSIENPEDFDFDAFRDASSQLGDAYKKAAKSAPNKKIKKAMKKIAKYYAAIGHLDSATDYSEFLVGQGAAYGKALRTITDYTLQNCLGTDSPLSDG